MIDRPTSAGQVGLNCPNCGENLRNAYVAKSHPTPGGQRRMRYCPGCHEPVDSLEQIAGAHRRLLVLDLATTPSAQVRLVRALCRELGVTTSTWGNS
jgi:transcriptional regulator NrdR family protein